MSDTVRFEIGKRIKVLRKWRSKSQKQLCVQLECSQAYLSDLERGNLPCPIATLIKICDILNVDLQYFDIRKPPVMPV